MNIIFDTKPRVLALNVKNFKPFITSHELILKKHTLVDSGLKEGRLYTRAAYLALVRLFKGSSKGETFDPRDFSYNDRVNFGQLPLWAVDSALSFHGHCLAHKLAIRIPI